METRFLAGKKHALPVLAILLACGWKDAPHWYKPNPTPKEYWAKGQLKM